MINPIVFKLGTLEIRAFTASVLVSTAVGVVLLMFSARTRHESLLRWIDTAFGALIGGIIGARAFHVALEWAYFSLHTDQITALANGGLDWHGAIVGGVIGAAIVSRLRGVSFADFADTIGVTFPIGVIAIWLACSVAAAGYGAEVRTLADFPAWLVTESPDVYGQIAPRLDLPKLGALIGGVLFVLMLALTAIRRVRQELRGLLFWIGLALFSFSMAIVDVFRGDFVASWFGHRADQVLDLAMLAFAVLMICATIAVFRLIRVRRPALDDTALRSASL